MLELLRDLIENAAIMIAGFYIIDKLLKEPLSLFSRTKEKIKVGVLAGALGIILMIFSITLTDGVIIDLRHIPIIVIGYYAGFIPAVLASVIIAVSRLFFGINSGAIYVFLQTMLTGILTGIISKYFRKGSFFTITLINVLCLIMIDVVLHIRITDKDLYRTVILFLWCIAIPSGIITTGFFRDLQRSKRLFHQYKDAAKTDFLTGLDNVRQFDVHFNRFIQQSNKESEQFSLLLIDIDHFKKVNDTYGHDAGDRVLQQLSRVIKQTTRPTDYVSRNGGEEFSVLLPESSFEQAAEVAERIRLAVESHSFLLPNGKELKLTISLGVSSYPDTTNHAEDTFKQADNALYLAKSSGRNQVKGSLI